MALSSESESEWMRFLSFRPVSLSLPELEDTNVCFSGRGTVKTRHFQDFLTSITSL